jgi:hypothetical protein
MMEKETVFGTVQKVTHDDLKESTKDKLLLNHSDKALIFKQRKAGGKAKNPEEE